MLRSFKFEVFAVMDNPLGTNGPTFFAKLIFFPPKHFLVFWKKEIFLSKKNFGGKKINLAKTILPALIGRKYHKLEISAASDN
jgi:hypothetical protein